MINEKQREHYRLAYPQTHRPILSVGFDQYEVEDVSEFGIKFRIEDELDFMQDDEVMAIIIFPDGREFDLSGHVVRIQDGYAGLKLDTALPNDLIRSEALSVLYNHPSQ